jgi:hypothetical protein
MDNGFCCAFHDNIIAKNPVLQNGWIIFGKNGIIIVDMCAQNVQRALIIVIFLSIFGGCGELDTVLPSTGTYQVRALVNDISLDKCAILYQGDKIRPYFVSSVVNDPDITGLIVFLQNAKGEIPGGKIQYTLELDETDKPGDPKTGSAGKTEKDLQIQDDEDKEIKEEDAGQASAGSAATNANAADNAPNAGTTAADPASDTKPAPGDPASDTMAQKSGTSVNTETLSAAGNEITKIPVKRLDRDLPYFSMPKDLAIGLYTLVFQVLGGKEHLQLTEKTFFYLSDARFSLRDIQMYPPGISLDSRLVSPGAAVLLEAKLDFDSRLDPYIIWYNGKKIISKGRISSGAGTILWKAPEQNGLHVVRAEVLPFFTGQKITGSFREISLPVSSKAVNLHLFYGNASELLHWYLFEGNLKDSKLPLRAEWALIPRDEKLPLWSPASSGYGLSAGSDDVYILPQVSFFRDKEKEGGGRIAFRFKNESPGGIFSALFALGESSGENLEVNLSIKNEKLILTVKEKGKSAEEISLPLNTFMMNDYITGIVDFSIYTDLFKIELLSEKDRLLRERAIFTSQKETESLSLAVSLNGLCVLRLGDPGSVQNKKSEAAQTGIMDNDKENMSSITAVWDELALIYSSPPPLPVQEEEAVEAAESEPGPETEPPAALGAAETEKTEKTESDRLEEPETAGESSLSPPPNNAAGSPPDSKTPEKGTDAPRSAAQPSMPEVQKESNEKQNSGSSA